MSNFYVGEKDFRVWLPEVDFCEKADDSESFDSRKLTGIMSTQRKDRQGEVVDAKGLEFDEFLQAGHFNDNHSQETSAIVGYPQSVRYHTSLAQFTDNKIQAPGWTCEGYVLKGTKRADGIWELAKALREVPNRKLGFSIEGKVLRRADKTIEKAKIRNVAITNCFPGDTAVSGAAEKAMRRWYSGDMIEINLATGEKLTGTPNHPIFTQRGWIALGEIDEVNDCVGRFDVDLAKAASFSKIAHDIDDVPTTIEQIFNASLIPGDSLWINKARERNFHGDGAGSDVDVVLSNGLLRDRLKASFSNKFGNNVLTVADKKLSRFFSLRLLNKLVHAGLCSASGFIRSFSKQQSLAGASSGISGSVGLLNRSSDAVSFGDIVNSFTSDSVSGGDKGRCLSASIGFSNVTLKRRFNFSGHVFNLDTKNGWYQANGIVVHNCPVNTDCTWDLIAKSFNEADSAVKAMTAGFATSPAAQTGGGAVRSESLDSDIKDVHGDKKKKKRQESLMRAIAFDDMEKAMELVLERRPDFDEDAAAIFIKHLFMKGGQLC